MFEYSPDHLAVIYRTNDTHRTLTFRTDQGINLVDFLDQSCPAFPECLFVSLWFKNAGDSIIVAFLLPFPPRDVAVIAVLRGADDEANKGRRMNANWYKPLLEVDGGVNLKNIKGIAQAGAEVLVAGASIFGSADYKKTIAELKAAIA